jgi:hypothetical protein
MQPKSARACPPVATQYAGRVSTIAFVWFQVLRGHDAIERQSHSSKQRPAASSALTNAPDILVSWQLTFSTWCCSFSSAGRARVACSSALSLQQVLAKALLSSTCLGVAPSCHAWPALYKCASFVLPGCRRVPLCNSQHCQTAREMQPQRRAPPDNGQHSSVFGRPGGCLGGTPTQC